MKSLLLSDTELGRAHLILVWQRCVDLFENLFLGELAGLLQFLHTGKEIAGTLIRILTRTPRIAAGMSLSTVVFEAVGLVVHVIKEFDVFFNRIHAASPNFNSVIILSNSMILSMIGLISASVGLTVKTSSF